MRKKIVVATMMLAALGALGSAQANVVVGVPGSAVVGFGNRAAVAAKAAPAYFVNTDVTAPHNVVSVATGPGNQPWCSKFPSGKCPLFYSEIADAGEYTEIKGLANATTGTLYEFYCAPHSATMRGQLVVV